MFLEYLKYFKFFFRSSERRRCLKAEKLAAQKRLMGMAGSKKTDDASDKVMILLDVFFLLLCYFILHKMTFLRPSDQFPQRCFEKIKNDSRRNLRNPTGVHSNQLK